MVVARACKEALSQHDSVQFEVTLSSGAVACTVTRAQFEETCKPLTQRTLNAVRKALRDAGLQKQDIQGVVMVGGSTRMPHIQTAVADSLGCEPLTNLNPDEVVALGAAIQANQLAGNNPQWRVVVVGRNSLVIRHRDHGWLGRAHRAA
jgi:molecular chaperone HscA